CREGTPAHLRPPRWKGVQAQKRPLPFTERASTMTATAIARVTAIAVGIAGVLAFGHAHAAAFQLKENSAKGLGRAFAGSTSAWDDASVVATNPASMRLLDGRQFQADVSAISFSADFEKFGARHNGAAGPGTGGNVSGGNGGDAGMI